MDAFHPAAGRREKANRVPRGGRRRHTNRDGHGHGPIDRRDIGQKFYFLIFMTSFSFSSLSKRRGATVAGIFSVALGCVALLCGAGSVPVENFLPQGAMQGDLNAGGHSLTNAATVSATNVVVSGSLSAPASFTLPFSQLTGTPTTLAGYGIADPIVLTSGSYANPSWLTSLAYTKLTGAPSAYALPVATSSVLGGVKQGANVAIAGDGTLSVSAPVTSLPFSSITGTPTTLAGYGIADPIVLTSGSYANPSWLTSLAYAKLTGAPLLATVATSGAYNDLTGKPTLGSLASLSPTGAAGSSTYLRGDDTWASVPPGYTLPAATTTALGGTIVPASGGLSVDGSGNISISAVAWTKVTGAPAFITASGAPVQSVAGRTGAIVLSASDISGLAASATTDTTNAGNITSGTLAAARVPTLNQNTTGTASNVTGIVAVANGGSGTATPSLVNGTGITITGSWPNQTIAASGGASGTVTSVALTSPGVVYSVTGSPVTSTGTLTLNLINQNANTIFGNATGSTGAPAFNTMSAYQGTGSLTFAAGNDTRFPASVTGLRKGAGVGSADTAAIAGTDYVAPNGSGAGLGLTKSSFLTGGFFGGYESGQERGYIMYSGDGVNWNQIRGLEKYTPPGQAGVSITGSGGSPDVFTSSVAHNMAGNNVITITGCSNAALNNTFTVATTPTTTTFTLYQLNTTTPVNGSGSSESGGSFSQVEGDRDVTLTKLGPKYYAAYTPSNVVFPFHVGIASSPDLINWTFVANNYNAGAASPRWFFDPATGNEYLVGDNTISQNTSTTGGYPDGVTWGAYQSFALAGGGVVAGGNSCLFKVGSTYCIIANPASVSNQYGIYTSSSLLTGYVYQGAPANWPVQTGLEGVRCWPDNTGKYWVYFSAGQYSTSTTPLNPSSWTAYSYVAGNNATIDNGSGYCFNDLDSFRDITNALALQPYFIANSLPDTSPSKLFPGSLNLVNAAQSYVGTGTITASGTTLTGVGTRFTHQLAPGSPITANGTENVVASVASDTSATMVVANASLTGPFIYDPPAISFGSSANNQNFLFFSGPYTVGSGSGPRLYAQNGCINWFDPTSAFLYNVIVNSTGWNLRNAVYGLNPVTVSNTAGTGDLGVTSTGITTIGNVLIGSAGATGLSSSAAGIAEVDSGTVGTFGQLQAGTIALKTLGTASAPTVALGGSGGSTTYTYEVVAKQADGTASPASSPTSMTNGPATLSTSGKANITVSAFVTGAKSYDIYRIFSGGSPSTTGKIGNITAAGQFSDTGLAADGTTPPSVNATGALSGDHISLASAQTTVSGSTSGTAIFSEPENGGSYKKVVVYCNTLVGAATYTFPTSFTNAPVVLTTSGPGASVVTTLSTTAMTVTGSSTTGPIIIEGY
jgi:hypothetical protein